MRNLPWCLVLVFSLALVACDARSPSPAEPEDGAALTTPTLKSDAAPEPGRVSIGGQLLQDDWKVTIAGQAEVVGGEPVSNPPGVQFFVVDGDWVVQFHHVAAPFLDGATFESTAVQSLTFYENEGAMGCGPGSMAVVSGTVDGAPGWSARIAMVSGADGLRGTVAIRLWGPVGEYYQTNGNFPDEATCAGYGRTILDRGNLIVRYPG